MAVTIPLLALAAGLCAARVRGAEVLAVPKLGLTLSPAVVGSACEPFNPAVERLDLRARELLNQPTPAAAAAYLDRLASPMASQVDRLAAGALARLVAEPGLAGAAAQAHPALSRLPLERLPFLLPAASPYRDGQTGERAAVAQLALAARAEPAIGALFDGLTRAQSIDLDDASLKGERLFVGGVKAREARRGRESSVFVHPRAGDLVVEASRRPFGVLERPHGPPLPEPEALLDRLAQRGHAPRTLARDVAFTNTLHRPMRALALRERVDGRSVWDLASHGSWTSEEREQVREALLAAARAGILVGPIGLQDVVLGTTPLRPQTRAYVVEPASLKASPRRLFDDADEVVDAWLAGADGVYAQWLSNARARAVFR